MFLFNSIRRSLARGKDEPIPLWKVIEDEYVALGNTLPKSYIDARARCLDQPADAQDAAPSSGRANDEILKLLYALFHERARDGRRRTALCFSGGGIRSATFNLGLLQRLSRIVSLDSFHYLSTVSGGGYIGSWLTGWIYREPGGVSAVEQQLSRLEMVNGQDQPASLSPTAPEPDPLRHLRTYSRYLSPRVGFLSADTWTLASIYVRNLFLNWLVLIPLLIAALTLPRFCTSFVALSLQKNAHFAFANSRYTIWTVTALGALLAMMSFIFAGTHQPSALAGRRRRQGASAATGDDDRPNAGQTRFLWGCLAPLLASAVVLSTVWLWAGAPSNFAIFVPLGILLSFPGWAAFRFKDRELLPLTTIIQEAILVVFAGLAAGLSLWGSAHLLSSMLISQRAAVSPGWFDAIYTCLAFPLTLMSLSAGGMMYVGLVSTLPTSRDEDREWWARFGAWVLVAVVVWLILSAVVLLGPAIILRGTAWVRAAITSVGGAAGLITLLLARGARTSAGRDKGGSQSARSVIAHYALAIAAPLFIVFLIAAVSLLTSAILATCRPNIHLRDAADHYSILASTSALLIASWTLLIAGFGFEMSRLLNLNKFSLHGMYRDRLIRAYLGASRGDKRSPDPFTGFDPLDNIFMHKLRPETLRSGDLTPGGDFCTRLASVAGKQHADDPRSEFLVRNLPETVQERLAEPGIEKGPPPIFLQTELLNEINALLAERDLASEAAFADLLEDLNPQEREILDLRIPARNRRLLELAYPNGIRPVASQRLMSLAPLHMVNVALNLVSGDDPAWQERKAESFTVSALHSGSARLGYRDSRTYGGLRGISLGTAVTISGAAVSPNMGYHSSKALSFLMTLFNVRLGWWLGNPGPAGDKVCQMSHPASTVVPLLAEAFGFTDAYHKYVYLSDGGHFENLGLYEMVRRRCHLIVVSDAGQDTKCEFSDLGNAVRKIRIDMGVPISFGKGITIVDRNATQVVKRHYCAVGRISYKSVDGAAAENGVLLYIKPAFYGNEPADVTNYAKTCRDFPHESTADQFFSETQFESYRALGYHIMSRIWDRNDGASEGVEELIRQACNYLAIPAPAELREEPQN